MNERIARHLHATDVSNTTSLLNTMDEEANKMVSKIKAQAARIKELENALEKCQKTAECGYAYIHKPQEVEEWLDQVVETAQHALQVKE